MNAKPQYPRGVTLLLALFVVMAILGSGLLISVVIVNDIRGSSNVVQAIKSSYAAESIVELAQWTVTNQRRDGKTLTNTLTTLRNLTLPDFQDPIAVDLIREEVSVSDVRTFLLANETLQLDLFDPDHLNEGATELHVTGITEGGWIEVTLLSVDEQGENPVSKKYLFSAGVGGKIDEKIGLVETQNIRGRIKALYRPVTNMVITATDVDGKKLIPGMLTYTAKGSSGDRLFQATSVVQPWTVPLSGLFDFAIFSESPIVK